MNWSLAIERNRAALVAVASAVAALVGGRDGLLARSLRNAALALLRPAEAAARRLIVIAARGVTARVRASRPLPPGYFGALARKADPARASGGRPPAFRLFDRPKRYRPMLAVVRSPRGEPRIRTFFGAPSAQPIGPQPPPSPAAPARARPDPDAPVDAARLRLRLAALQAALADLPRQAARLARLRAKLHAMRANATDRPPRSPLRLGRPPGYRARPARELDRVLRDCHALALDALRPAALAPDTS